MDPHEWKHAVWKQATGGMTAWMDNAPTWVVNVFDRASKWAGITWSKESGDPNPPNDGRRAYSDLRGAEAIGSCIDRGRATGTTVGMFTLTPYEPQHIVMLDIDHEAILIPSSTPGHHHLIVNLPLDWSAYVKLLAGMAEAGLIQQGFYEASRDRGETFLRLPWIRKGSEANDASEAIAEWLDADDRPEEFQDPEALETWLATPVD